MKLTPTLKLIVKVFINNAAVAVEMISGRQLSMAELGAIQEQVIAAIQAAYLRGKLETLKKVLKNEKPVDSTRVSYFDKLYAERQRSSSNSGNSNQRD